MDGTQVLIAEDNANSARLIADYLAAKGAQTTWKKDGGEALKAARQYHYDLLILDLRLPGKNGFVVAREIRKDEQLFNLPIIVTSAFPDKQNLLHSYQLGVDHFLSKPVNLEKLYWQAKSLTSRQIMLEDKTIRALNGMNSLSEKKLNRSGHGARVMKNCLALAAASKLKERLASLRTAALLHDLGLIFTHSSADHGPIGATIVRSFGVKEEIAFLIEKHHAPLAPARKLGLEETLEDYLEILKTAEKIEEIYRGSPPSFHQDKERGLFTPERASVINKLIKSG